MSQKRLLTLRINRCLLKSSLWGFFVAYLTKKIWINRWLLKLHFWENFLMLRFHTQLASHSYELTYIQEPIHYEDPYIFQWTLLDDVEGTHIDGNSIKMLLRVSWESFLHLNLLVRVNTADLSYFDEEPNSVTPRLRMSNFETARLMSYSGHILVSICRKWLNDGKSISTTHRVER